MTAYHYHFLCSLYKHVEARHVIIVNERFRSHLLIVLHPYPSKLIVLTPCCFPCTSSSDCANTFTDYVYTFVNCIDTSVDFTKWKAHYSDPLWSVTLYYFLRMCMFECIPPQTFDKFSQYYFKNNLNIIFIIYNIGLVSNFSIVTNNIVLFGNTYCTLYGPNHFLINFHDCDIFSFGNHIT
jgi:hypothetical protein